MHSITKQDMVAFFGEMVGTTMFIFLGLGGVTTAIYTESVSQQQTAGVISSNNQTVMFIALSMGFSLLVNAWVFYRITGGLFNPVITFALWAIGGVSSLRAVLLTVAQIVGGILGAGLAEVLIPYSLDNTVTTLAVNMNIGMGLMLEAFLTAMLVFTVLMLAAEKHKATFIAPIGIGLVLFVCQLVGTEWTGCGMNPARAFGPSVITRDFPGYHWIYWVGPYIGAIIAVGFYAILKAFDYGSVVLGQDSDKAAEGAVKAPRYARALERAHLTHAHREALAATGMSEAKIDALEKDMQAKHGPKTPAQANGSPNGAAKPGVKTAKKTKPTMNRHQSSQADGAVGVAAPFATLPGFKNRDLPTVREKHTGGVHTGADAQQHGGISAPHTHTGIGLGALLNKK